jgi:hypothetical protein
MRLYVEINTNLITKSIAMYTDTDLHGPFVLKTPYCYYKIAANNSVERFKNFDGKIDYIVKERKEPGKSRIFYEIEKC